MKSFYEFYLQIQRENAAAPAAGAAPAAAPAAGAAAAPAAAGAAPAAAGATPAAGGTAKPVPPQDPGVAAFVTAVGKNTKVYQDALSQIKDPKLAPAAKAISALLNPQK